MAIETKRSLLAMNQKKSITFISTNSAWGGSEKLWTECAEKLLRLGNYTRLVTNSEIGSTAKIRKIITEGAEMISAPLSESRQGWIKNRLRRLRPSRRQKPSTWGRIISSEGCFCISQGTWDELLWDYELSIELANTKSPFIILARSDSSRGVLSDAQRSIGRTIFQKASHVIPASRSTAEVAELNLACTLHNCTVLHSPIKLPSKRTISLSTKEEATFACVGRLQCINKGQNILLKALSAAEWKDRSWRLLLYGRGPDYAYLNELVSHFKLRNRVEFKGYEEDVDKIWSEADILVQPSVIEGVPQTMLEAMARGKPVIGTKVSGIPEWIEDDISGFLADSPNPESLSLALERAWEARKRWDDIGAKAQERFNRLADPDPADTLARLMLQLAAF